MRRSIIVAVWKEKLTWKQSCVAAQEIRSNTVQEQWPFEIGIAPSPFSYVAVRAELKDTGLKCVSQNILWESSEGSFIGETTASMLCEVGCDFAIVGHSERRMHFCETDEIVARKVQTAARNGITPILCFGDNASQKETGETKRVIETQLGAAFELLGGALSPASLVLAYEPVWAISTWRSARPLPTGDEVARLHRVIRDTISKLEGSQFATEVSLLYGGSVAPDNAEDYMSFEDVDGALVGGASKDPTSFINTLRAARCGVVKR